MPRLPRIALAAVVLLAGCGGGSRGGPPEIRYGLEECGYCRMIISEEKFAAAVVEEVGTTASFDDVGCLLDHLRESSAAAKEVWVHDHAGGGWIAAETAWFVRGPRSATPMGSGLVAYASRQQADAYAADRGTSVEAWTGLLD